jgi:hypothetical protein
LNRTIAARVTDGSGTANATVVKRKPGWCMLRKNSEGGLMGIKTCLAGLCLAVLAATVIDVPPVEAQTYTAQPDRPVNRPRARITVEPRSFLDAGTEVLPGERKFTDYAFPAGSYSMPSSVVQSTGGRVGWHQSPLPGPFDLPSRYNPYGW